MPHRYVNAFAFKQLQNIKIFFKLLFSCNNQTRFGDTSNGISRRLIFIPLKADFRESGDTTLGDRLSNEEVYESLLLNSINGLKRLMKRRKFTTTASINQELDDYIYNNNPVIQFMDETYSDVDFNEMDIEARMCQTVYDRYRSFCSQRGLKSPLSSNGLGQELKRLGYEHVRRGIDVKSKAHQDTVYKRPYVYKKI